MKSKIRVLSLDGGGIRGIVSGEVMVALEKKLQEKTNNPEALLIDYVDYISGTSTGGILALLMLMPDKDGKPKYSAEDAVNFYFERGPDIFRVSLWQKIKSLWGLIQEKYDSKALKEHLEDVFGDVMFDALIKPCVIPAYDIEKDLPFFFRKHPIAAQQTSLFRVRDAARATSAAPTYFEAAKVEDKAGVAHTLIDGGVFANDPSLVAYSELRGFTSIRGYDKPHVKDMMFVSIGTGSEAEHFRYKKVRNWGQIEWAVPLISLLMSANSNTVGYHMKSIYDTLGDDEGKSDYYKLNPEIITADMAIDNASLKNMLALKEDAETFIARPEIDAQLHAIADKLIQF